MGEKRKWEPLSSQRSCSYKLRFEDIGRRLRCECIVSDVFGRSSEPAYAETEPVLPGTSFKCLFLPTLAFLTRFEENHKTSSVFLRNWCHVINY